MLKAMNVDVCDVCAASFCNCENECNQWWELFNYVALKVYVAPGGYTSILWLLIMDICISKLSHDR